MDIEEAEKKSIRKWEKRAGVGFLFIPASVLFVLGLGVLERPLLQALFFAEIVFLIVLGIIAWLRPRLGERFLFLMIVVSIVHYFFLRDLIKNLGIMMIFLIVLPLLLSACFFFLAARPLKSPFE